MSESPDYFKDRSCSGLGDSDGFHWGASASSLPEAAGLVRIKELRTGRIEHALAFDIGSPCAKVFVWPAQRTDGLDPRKDVCILKGHVCGSIRQWTSLSSTSPLRRTPWR